MQIDTAEDNVQESEHDIEDRKEKIAATEEGITPPDGGDPGAKDGTTALSKAVAEAGLALIAFTISVMKVGPEKASKPTDEMAVLPKRPSLR